MIKVKTFVPRSTNPIHHQKLDDAINQYIADNAIDVIDIKYSASFCSDSGRGSFLHSAMLIYKTKE